MKKMLTVSLVAILGVAGGGAYMLMGSDKHISEYIPESVTALVGDYLPDSLMKAPETIAETDFVADDADQFVEETHIEEVDSFVDAEPIQGELQAQQQNSEDLIQQQQPLQSEREMKNTPESMQHIQKPVVQNTENSIDIAMDQNLEAENEDVVSLAMQEIQNSLNATTPSVEKVLNSPEAKIIENKIVAVNSKIMELDIENKQLEQRFQEIMRKNRELAQQLQKIDQQLVKSN